MMVADNLREFYEVKARERMLAGKKADPVENFPEGECRACDQAGAATNQLNLEAVERPQVWGGPGVTNQSKSGSVPSALRSPPTATPSTLRALTTKTPRTGSNLLIDGQGCFRWFNLHDNVNI